MLLKKKLSPVEMKIKVMMAEKKLKKREDALEGECQGLREKAKAALQSGDERAFRIASRRFALVQGQRASIGNLYEMASNIRALLEMQEQMGEIVEISSELRAFHKHLGIDTDKLDSAIGQISTSMGELGVASEMISTSVDALVETSASDTIDDVELRAELLAEIEMESGQTEDLERKIREARDS